MFLVAPRSFPSTSYELISRWNPRWTRRLAFSTRHGVFYDGYLDWLPRRTHACSFALLFIRANGEPTGRSAAPGWLTRRLFRRSRVTHTWKILGVEALRRPGAVHVRRRTQTLSAISRAVPATPGQPPPTNLPPLVLLGRLRSSVTPSYGRCYPPLPIASNGHRLLVDAGGPIKPFHGLRPAPRSIENMLSIAGKEGRIVSVRRAVR